MALSTDKNIFEYLGIILTVIFTSCYFFPFETVYYPGINSKMVIAGFGLCLLGIQLSKHRTSEINRDFFSISLIAFFISLLSFVAIVYNSTNDTSFVFYFVSMWVWLGGAYTLVKWIKFFHKGISIRLLSNYLITVCVIQCLLAYAIDIYLPLQNLVNQFLGGEASMGIAEGRLYGIGCALDVAGFRFSAVLVMIAYLCIHEDTNYIKKNIVYYLLAFVIIAILGNMISRSTVVGVALAIAYWTYASIFRSKNQNVNVFVWRWFGTILLIGIPLMMYLYHTNQTFHENLRFGFEGFFSLFEKGEWEVSSNDILFNHMIRFPETLKTWLIGDGYAVNPSVDPYYTGKAWHGYYMGTDIGYLRYIFYFGIFGLFAFIMLICKSTLICISRFPKYKILFILLLFVNLIGWFKVSTDIFLVFALFLVFDKNDESSNQIINQES